MLTTNQTTAHLIFNDLKNPAIIKYWLYSLVLSVICVIIVAVTFSYSIFEALATLHDMLGTFSFIWPMLGYIGIAFSIVFGGLIWSLLHLLVLSFFTPAIIRQLAVGTLVTLHDPGFLFIIAPLLRTIFMHLLILPFVLLFSIIPVIGLFMMPIWGWSIYRALLVIDCASVIMDNKDFFVSTRTWAYGIPALVGWTLAFIPIANLFAPMVAIIMCARVMLLEYSNSTILFDMDNATGKNYDESV